MLSARELGRRRDALAPPETGPTEEPRAPGLAVSERGVRGREWKPAAAAAGAGLPWGLAGGAGAGAPGGPRVQRKGLTSGNCRAGAGVFLGDRKSVV